MSKFEDIGRDYVIDQINGLELAKPGWLPMFYMTGSYEGDLQAAQQLRDKFEMPRPADVIARISSDKTEHTRRVAIAQAERDYHERMMREDWFYWIKHKLGFAKRDDQ